MAVVCLFVVWWFVCFHFIVGGGGAVHPPPPSVYMGVNRSEQTRLVLNLVLLIILQLRLPDRLSPPSLLLLFPLPFSSSSSSFFRLLLLPPFLFFVSLCLLLLFFLLSPVFHSCDLASCYHKLSGKGSVETT